MFQLNRHPHYFTTRYPPSPKPPTPLVSNLLPDGVKPSLPISNWWLRPFFKTTKGKMLGPTPQPSPHAAHPIGHPKQCPPQPPKCLAFPLLLPGCHPSLQPHDGADAPTAHGERWGGTQSSHHRHIQLIARAAPPLHPTLSSFVCYCSCADSAPHFRK
jgi:hypothetical protein